MPTDDNNAQHFYNDRRARHPSKGFTDICSGIPLSNSIDALFTDCKIKEQSTSHSSKLTHSSNLLVNPDDRDPESVLLYYAGADAINVHVLHVREERFRKSGP